MEEPCARCGYQPNPVQIIQGGHATFIAMLVNPQTRLPLDLTDASSISTCFYNADGSELMLSLGSGLSIPSPANLGRIQVDITAAQTALLRTVSLSTLEFEVSISSGDPVKSQIRKAYWVSQSVC